MILDFDLDFLRAAAALVDASLQRLNGEARSSLDPDQFGIFDEMEYVTGFGFVACQAYATAALSLSLKNKKHEALALGPKHRTGRTMAQLTSAAANYWKHSPEWSLDAPTTQAKQTLDVIQSLGVNTNVGAYPLANTLYEILRPLPARFANLIPFLIQWRDALPR
jgi:hypothetical protein